MCIIAVSRPGCPQPDEYTLRTMFQNNPHGAGYMYARNGKVTIHKGFMNIEDFIRTVRRERFTEKDSVVYHFRISTQAGVNPEMTHPFPLTDTLAFTKKYDLVCPCGVAHNGIITLTSDPDENEYSDTALFITRYMSRILRHPDDLRNPAKLGRIMSLARSKFAILDGDGYIATVGEFINWNGILYSNLSFLPKGLRGWTK